MEEILLGAENGGEDISGSIPFVESIQVVEPKIVFDKESDIGVNQVGEQSGVADGVGRQVANQVCTVIVFAYFVAGRGEEGEANFKVGMFFSESLDDRARLLEFAEGRGVEPSYRTFEFMERDIETPSFPASSQQLSLGIEKGSKTHRKGVETNSYAV